MNRNPWLETASQLRDQGLQWTQIAAKVGATKDSVRHAVRRFKASGLAPHPHEKGGPTAASTPLAKPEAGTAAVPRAAPVAGTQTTVPPPAPSVHTASKTSAGNTLVISDPQEPYALEDAVAFCRRVRAEFNIPRENVVHVGDEADFLYGSRFPVDPNNENGPLGELRWLRERMKVWYAEHPRMRLCISNHTDRWYKKAAGAQIPEQLIRARHEILEAPEGWVWADHWDFRDGKMPWRVEHGHNGAASTRLRAIENGVSTAHGHFHAKAGVEWVHTAGGQLVWGLATGALIDVDAVAFKYNRRDRFKPVLGLGVVLDGGRKPLFVPYDR